MPRLNLEITEQQMESLRLLEARTGASNMKELVNNALSVFEWAVDETAKGNEVAAVNEEESAFRVLVTPLLRYVARHEGPVQAMEHRVAAGV